MDKFRPFAELPHVFLVDSEPHKMPHSTSIFGIMTHRPDLEFFWGKVNFELNTLDSLSDDCHQNAEFMSKDQALKTSGTCSNINLN